MSEKILSQDVENKPLKFNFAHIFGAGAIIFIAFLSATYIPAEYIDYLKSYFFQVSKIHFETLDPSIKPESLNQLLKHENFDENYRLIECFFTASSEKEFNNEHIPKAIYFDVLHGAEANKFIPKNIPKLKEFEEYISSLGISNDHHVIIYDRSEFGFFTAPRAWYLFKLYGHDKVSILNGGFNGWKNLKLETTNEMFKPSRSEFKANFNKSLIRTYEDIAENLKSKEEVLIDSREADEFNAKIIESGVSEHIPNSINLPYTALFDSNKKTSQRYIKIKRVI